MIEVVRMELVLRKLDFDIEQARASLTRAMKSVDKKKRAYETRVRERAAYDKTGIVPKRKEVRDIARRATVQLSEELTMQAARS